MKQIYDLVIIGSGPRGLAVALEAIHKNLSFLIIDPIPMKTWTKDNVLIDFEMRSPISFDLVSYLEDRRELSLATFLNREDITFTKCQKQIEIYKNRTLRRTDFIKYLTFIKDYILNRNIKIEESKVLNIDKVSSKEYQISINKDKKVTFVYSKSIAICTGGREYPILPLSLKSCNNCITLPTLIKNLGERNKIDNTLGIVGSGQSSFETVLHLANLGKKVYCFINTDVKVSKYPVPSYESVGIKSALGSYYSMLTEIEDKKEYFSIVKDWQPSVTPEIYNSVINHPNVQVIKDEPYSYKDKINHFVILVGQGFKLEEFPLFLKSNLKERLIPDNLKSNLPQLSKSFNLIAKTSNKESVSEELIFFSGLASAAIDGPRQGSIISSGITARTIINAIVESP